MLCHCCTEAAKSSPKTLKLVNFNMGVKKEPKNSYGSYPKEFVPEVKNTKKNSSWTNSFSDPKGEVSNLKRSFKNPPDKILIWTAMNSRQTAVTDFFFRKNLFYSDKKF
jgi:hypothetical protein